MKYLVKFTRVGRSHDVPDLTTEWTDPEAIEAEIAVHVRPYLHSAEYGVMVDLGTGRGWINGGRFGTFTLSEVT